MKAFVKRRIFTPGPTPLLPEAVIQPLLTPMHHRKDDFKAVFRDVQKGLQEIFNTENEILLLSCSGSGAMEAALTNLTSAGDTAIVAVCGKFGERWLELAGRFGLQAHVIEVPYGRSVEPAQIEQALSVRPDAVALFIQATETSTGARMDLERIGAAVQQHGRALLVVDAITGLGTMPIRTDDWGLDIVIGGSQKAFMVPPGVAMMSVSARAWKRIEACERPRYYFDLLRERKGQRDGQSAFTPTIPVIQGLKVALDYIREQGIDSVVQNAALQAGATRAALCRIGMKIFPDHPGNAITAFVPGDKVDVGRVISILRDRFGILVSGGQGTLKGKIVRVGHLGYFDFPETIGMLGCLELALVEAGADLEPGAGVQAALEYYRNAQAAS